VPTPLIRLVGELRDGPAPGCLLLRTATKEWSLVGEPVAALQAGLQVEVRGYASPHIRSACGAEVFTVTAVTMR